jgi:hypothetical protein
MGSGKVIPMRMRAPQAERGLDLYETCPEAVYGLLKVEPLPHHLWDPACGRGALVRVLRQAGHSVLATDLVDYHSPDQDAAGWDFLMEYHRPEGIEAIVANPPYALGTEFVERALALCPKVVMLLRLTFLESARRRPLLEGGRFARLHVFRERLPMMHRDGWQGNKASNPTAFGWFVFERDHNGPPTIHWLSGRTKRELRA